MFIKIIPCPASNWHLQIYKCSVDCLVSKLLLPDQMDQVHLDTLLPPYSSQDQGSVWHPIMPSSIGVRFRSRSLLKLRPYLDVFCTLLLVHLFSRTTKIRTAILNFALMRFTLSYMFPKSRHPLGFTFLNLKEIL